MAPPPLLGWPDGTLVALAGLAAGFVNAIAGGGSLLSFPALIAAGLPPLVANASNTVALCSGYLGATCSQRRELRGQGTRLALLLPVAAAGGLVGGLLLLGSEERLFTRLVPWLILSGAALLALQEPLAAWLRRRRAGRHDHRPAATAMAAAPGPRGSQAPGAEPAAAATFQPLGPEVTADREGLIETEAARPTATNSATGSTTGRETDGATAALPGEAGPTAAGSRPDRDGRWTAMVLVFPAAVYGGYFGAGLSVILLAALAISLEDGLGRLNGLKQAIALATNLLAAGLFVLAAPLHWPSVLLLAATALVGGAIGGRLASRIPPQRLRGLVVGVALLVAAAYLRR